MENIFVTGGSGFIGGHLINALLALGHQVTNYDKDPRHFCPGARHITADICDGETLNQAMRGHTVVCHLAAMLGVTNCIRHEAEMIRNNYDGVKNILQACASNAVSRILFASSSEVYGEGSHGRRLTEADRLAPLSVYGKYKAMAEQLMHEYALRNQVQVTVLRYCNVYGGHQKLDFVIPAFISRVLRSQPLLLCNGGSQIRNYTYADDAASGTVAALFRPEADYRIYNICSEYPVSVKQLAEKIVALHGSGQYRPADFEELQRRADFEVECRMPSGEKAKAELGFQAQINIDQGLAATYMYYQEQLPL